MASHEREIRQFLAEWADPTRKGPVDYEAYKFLSTRDSELNGFPITVAEVPRAVFATMRDQDMQLIKKIRANGGLLPTPAQR
mgnify:CR=1 FL=1